MGLSSLFKLEKLTITAYKTSARSGFGTSFEAMFNPSTYSQAYAIEWKRKQGINDSGAELEYTLSSPAELKLNLIFDGTGVDDYGLVNWAAKTVSERVQEFLDVTTYQGLAARAGVSTGRGGAISASAVACPQWTSKYTAFDRDGTPLRAELSVTLIGDIALDKLAKEAGKTSPDHARPHRQAGRRCRSWCKRSMVPRSTTSMWRASISSTTSVS